MSKILLTFLADYLFAILVIVAAGIILRTGHRRGEIIVRGLLASISALIIDKSSGLVFYHDRPFVVLHKDPLALNPHNNAFPSDHALLVFAAAFVVWVATKNWKYGVALLLGGVVVGWARVEALVHWPIDIVGSFVIAGVMVALWFTIPLPQAAARFYGTLDRFITTRLPATLTGQKKRK